MKNNQSIMYARVGNIEQLDFYVKEKITNKLQSKVAGLYIRTNCKEDCNVRNSIELQRNRLEDYCKENKIENTIEYIDIRKSGTDKERKALQTMIQDIKNKKINIIITNSISTLFRTPIEMDKFLRLDGINQVELKSLDGSTEYFNQVYINLLNNEKFRKELNWEEEEF